MTIVSASILIKKDSGPRKYPNFYKNEVILKNQSCHQSIFVLKSPPFLSVYPIVEMQKQCEIIFFKASSVTNRICLSKFSVELFLYVSYDTFQKWAKKANNVITTLNF